MERPTEENPQVISLSAHMVRIAFFATDPDGENRLVLRQWSEKSGTSHVKEMRFGQGERMLLAELMKG